MSTTASGNGTIQTRFTRAVMLQQSGNFVAAEDLYHSILREQPAHPEVSHNLALLLLESGRALQGLATLETALRSQPSNRLLFLARVDTLIHIGQLESADNALEDANRLGLQGPQFESRALRLAKLKSGQMASRAAASDHAELFALFRQKCFGELEARARELSDEYPQDEIVWQALGLALSARGDLDSACSAMRKAVGYQPDSAEAHNNLGLILQQRHCLLEAEACYREALKCQPNLLGALHNLGVVLRELCRYAESEGCLRAVLRLNPDFADAHCNLGGLFAVQNRLPEAEVCYRSALRLQPESADAHFLMGRLHLEMGKLKSARERLANALTLAPDHALSHQCLGNVSLASGDPMQSLSHFRHALALDPSLNGARSSLLFAMNYQPDIHSDDILETAKEYGKELSRFVSAPYSSWRVRPDPARLKVGFVSGDFRQHPVGYFLEGILPMLDTSRLELIAYPTVVESDVLTEQLKQGFSSWRPLYGLDDDTAAARIHSDGIHVLIDLSGHNAHHRLGVFARKPAPVQVSWPGYFATTGVTEIDWIIADPITVPASRRSCFTEDVWYLPITRLCFTPPIDAPPVSALPMLHNGYVTFGCFQNLNKINDRVLRLWGRIMTMLPEARLRMQTAQLGHEEHTSQLLDRLFQVGIDPARVQLCPAESRMDYLRAHAEVDIVLDTFPYTGGTTTCEALWMGVPTLTLSGQTLIARQGASIMSAAGLSAWIVEDEDAYVSTALAHTRNTDALARLRANLRDDLLKSTLFDVSRFAHEIECAVWGMWHQAETSGTLLIEEPGIDPETNPLDACIVPKTGPDSDIPSEASYQIDVDTRMEKLLALFRAKEFETLVEQARSLTAEQPELGLAWKILGLALRELNQMNEAAEAMRVSVDLLPEDVEAHGNLGIVLVALGNLDEAASCHLRALELNPDDADSHHNLALVHYQQKKLEAATDSLRMALRIDPGACKTQILLGKILYALKKSEEAEVCLRKAVDLQPQSAEVHYLLGNLLLKADRFDEAETQLLRAHSLDANHIHAIHNLSLLYHKQDRPVEAERWARVGLVLKPEMAFLHESLAGPLSMQGRHAEAIKSLQQAISLAPESLGTRSSLLFILNYDADTRLADLHHEACSFGEIISRSVESQYTKWNLEMRPTKLRVGFVSGDFRHHPVGYFLEGILPMLDSSCLTLIAYPTVTDEDLLTEQLKSSFDEWVPIVDLDDATAAERIHSDGIQVLIDLSGHTAHQRLGVFAYKPAPVQVSWPGYFATTGMTEIDWFLADPMSVPESSHAFFTEGIWQLPHTRLCFTPPLDAPSISELPMLRSGHPTFGCFQTIRKLGDQVLQTWKAVLQAIPHARMRIQCKELRHAEGVSQFLARCEALGLDTTRIDCHPSTGRLDYLAAHAEVDIILDTFPYTGGTTTCEALWMGVPTLTLAGETLIARQGASLMQAAGLSDWIVHDTQSYIIQACEKVRDVESLTSLRRSLRAQLLQGPLFDIPGFAREIENALWGMWRDYESRQTIEGVNT